LAFGRPRWKSTYSFRFASGTSGTHCRQLRAHPRCDRLDGHGSDECDFIAIREERTAHALVPDFVRQFGLLDLVVAKLLEEAGDVGEREDGLDLQLLCRLPAGLEKPSPDALPLKRLGDRQAFQLGEILPEHMKRGAADEIAAVVGNHEELANRFVELSQ